MRFKFGPFLTFVLHHRYLLIVISISMLIVTTAYALSGRMGMQIFPRVPADYAQATLKMPLGILADETKQIVKKMIDAAYIIEKEKGLSGYIKGVYARIGSEGAHEALIRVYLPPATVREKLLSTADFVQLWRQKIGEVPGSELLKFSAHSRGPGDGSAISLEIRHSNLEILKEASRLIAQELHKHPRVYDISDGFKNGKPQINFTLKPLAYILGFDARTIAREVRTAFYGAESQRILVDNNEIKVMVKLPKKERETLETLYNLRLFKTINTI